MEKMDAILSMLCGLIISVLVSDFLKEWGIGSTIYSLLSVWIFLPLASLCCLWLAFLIGKKYLVVFQVAKHVLVGALATVVDLKIFEFLVFSLGILFFVNPLFSKGFSFLISTFIKYLGNKYWAFQKHETENVHKEVIIFLFITIVGLIIDVGFFYYFTKVIGAQFAVSPVLWIKCSVILSAIIAAVWNFLGYKLLVFKK